MTGTTGKSGQQTKASIGSRHSQEALGRAMGIQGEREGRLDRSGEVLKMTRSGKEMV